MNKIRSAKLILFASISITFRCSTTVFAEGFTLIDIARAEAAREKKEQDCKELNNSIERVIKQNEKLSKKTPETEATYHSILASLNRKKSALGCD